MINISNLSKNYGKKVLFEGISLSINDGEKIGLLGPNGAGKSTLFEIILGQVESSSGVVQVNKNTRIAYLPQESKFSSEQTVLSELISGDEQIKKLNREKDELVKNNLASSIRYSEILDRLNILGYFELEHRAEKILMGLGFKESDFNRPINNLSGGWQMRTLLAKLLTGHYDILLLDEPTNYLDLNAALWFKDYLTSFQGTFIMISHDKAYLNDVTNYTLILENGSIFKVKGNYEHYEQIREEKKTFLLKQFKEQEKKREQLEKFISRFHAQPNKASQVRAKKTALEHMEEIIVPEDPGQSIRDFNFPQCTPSGHKVITLANVSKSYGDVRVYKDFDFEVEKGEKGVLVGENGVGKSTLLKIMAGVVDIDSGTRIVGHNTQIGYFSQTRLDVLTPDNSVLKEAYLQAPRNMSEQAVRTILGAFLFRGDEVEKKVKVLSGGEKSRLILAKLLIAPPNFLLLDEPTTHLDVDAVDALVRAVLQYTGTIIFISHDIYFVRSIANFIFEVKDGSVSKIHGNFDYYLEKKAKGEINRGEFRPQGSEPESIEVDNLEKQDLQDKQLRQQLEKNKEAKKIREKIKKLKRQRESLRFEMYAKKRAIAEPRSYRNEDETISQYEQRVKEIENKISQIDADIRQLKSSDK